MNKIITLQQDSRDKLVVSIEEKVLVQQMKKYFKWRKNITIGRLNELGTHDYNDFIEYLITFKQITF